MFNLDELTAKLMISRGVGMTRPSQMGDFGLSDAYRVAHQLRDAEHSSGKKLAGRKIGISNPAAWDKLGLDDIVWGYLFDDTVVEAKDDTFELSLNGLSQPKLEPEIVFGLKSELPTSTRDAADLLRHVEWLALGFEIVQNPYPNWAFTAADLVATYGFHASLVYGNKVLLDDPEFFAEVLAHTKVKLYKDESLLLEGAGTNVLDSPAIALGHLADLIATDIDATPLSAGEVITSGTLTSAADLKAGESYRVSVTGLGLSDFTLRVT